MTAHRPVARPNSAASPTPVAPRSAAAVLDEPPADLLPARLSANARIVLAKRYLKKDESGEPTEEPEAMFWRIARVVAEEDRKFGASDAAVEEVARNFYDLMTQGRFEPNSPTLMNAGRPLGQLSACFVLPVEDALSNGGSGIYDTLRAMALVHQSGGGTGFSFSRLRPVGDTVRSTMGVASGPVSFMRLYDASTEVVKQGGTRRGANMGILRVDHPDIRDFVRCKNDTSQITNFNISVAVTDAFMAAVEADEEYDLVSPRNGEPAGRENAREIFDMIVEGAWKTGEPGVFFVDRANEHNPVPRLGDYEATNPCGEQPLLPYDVCNLGSINVGAYVEEGDENAAADAGDPSDRVDWDGLAHAVHLSVHFLDNVIDANRYPLREIEELAQNIRRVGLGIMGWADLLVRLDVRYDSEEGVELGRTVMAFIEEETRKASERLAEARGVFPAWEDSIWGPDETCARNAAGERVRPCRRLRNCNLTTVAPTGTISIIAGCSGGIEPLFAVAFMRNQAGVMMPDANPDFVARAKREGWYDDGLMERIAQEGHIRFDEVPADVQAVYRTSHDISPEWHVRMQAAFQEHVDSAISKTTNFAFEAARDDVRKIYELAFGLGCKGVTVYRDGSRPMQVLSTGKTGQEQGASQGADAGGDAEVETLRSQLADARERAHRLEGERDEARAGLDEMERRNAVRQKRTRPQTLRGRTAKMKSPLGDLYVTINEDRNGRPFEVFCTLGKAGGAAMADSEAIGRLASLALRSGIPITAVRDQLRGISCDRAVGVGPYKVLSAPDAVAQAIEQYLEEKAGTQQELFSRTGAGVAAAAEPDGAGGGGAGGGSATEASPGGFRQTGYVDHGDTALGACPACGSSQLAFEEGCRKCYVCGFSECG